MFPHHSIIHMQFKIALTFEAFYSIPPRNTLRIPEIALRIRVHMYLYLYVWCNTPKKRSYLKENKANFSH